MKFILISLVSLITFASNFYYPNETLKKLNDNSVVDSELKDEIFYLLNSYHRRVKGDHDIYCKGSDGCYRQQKINYREAKRYLFGSLHLQRNQFGEYFVRDVYCHKIFTNDSPNIGKVGPNKIPNHQVVNCEHTWPQSRFSGRFDRRLQKGDLHHLYPTDSKANSVRSSNDFGNIKGGDAPTVNCDASRATRNTYEPPHEHKGNVARSMFYFSIRYQIPINERVERVLKQWHIQDPVDREEVIRNSEIYKIQNNRNPFIDFPDLVDRIRNF